MAGTFLEGPSYVIGQYIIAGDAVHSGQLLATQARDNTKLENTITAKKMMKTKPVQRKKQLKKQKIELSPETQTPLEQIELVTDKTNDVKRTLRQVQKQVAKARGANKGT